MDRTDRLWRGLSESEELAVQREFPMLAEAARLDRRLAMKLLGASAALAAAAACERKPGSKPSAARGTHFGDYARPVTYATTLEQSGVPIPVLVETVNGWPIKIDGNPAWGTGGSSAITQAQLLDFYNPLRLTRPLLRGKPARPAAVEEALSRLARGGGRGVHILRPPTSNIAVLRAAERAAAALPDAQIHEWAPILPEAPFDPAPGSRSILCIGADFLGPGPHQAESAAAWAAWRGGSDDRRHRQLFVAECVPTLTGARADRRLRLAPRDLLQLAHEGGRGALARRLGLPDVDQVLIGRELQDDGAGDLLPLVAALRRGEVETLIVLGGNPAYDAPADLDFAAAMKHAGSVIVLADTLNETAGGAGMLIPEASQLERWGEYRRGGNRLLSQPLAGTKVRRWSAEEILDRLAGTAETAQPAWMKAVHEQAFAAGGESGAAADATETGVSVRSDDLPDGLILVFRPDASVWDGAHADNPWLQELPDPISKLVWGNAATVASSTAGTLGLENGDIVAIESAGRRIEAPIWVLPGQAGGTVALPLGYGRAVAGLGSDIGINAYRLRTARHPWYAPCTVAKTEGRAVPISTELHHPLAEDVPARRMSRRDEAEQPAFYRQQSESGQHQWGMVIDLDACIGCSACTVACQAENNIPVVGPEEVARGREMHWLRIDRYWRGDTDDPGIDFMPVPCMHCETAPCEPVCPVGATVHSSEGLNQMVYPRCIGTRTCANNCPYKVRRFNWFDYQEEAPRSEQSLNPRVSVRERGVMEKCTYCVQRIEAVHAGDKEGPVRTACQQACPTEAITFGDLADPDSDVARKRASPRNYALLGGLNLAPRTTYLARREEDGDG